jgi:thymidylate synthase (FAD)
VINESDSAKDKEKALKLINRVISSGHYSTIEHIQVSFAITGISRACSHQIVRHRLMSFSQKSQRYVREKEQFDYVVPKSIEQNAELLEKYHAFMSSVTDLYIEMTEKGILAEDARMILPNATATSMVASLNLRELIHLANLRLCSRAQLEIRTMVKMMCAELIKTEPWLKDYLVPKCERLGFCDEDKTCGRKAKKG